MELTQNLNPSILLIAPLLRILDPFNSTLDFHCVRDRDLKASMEPRPPLWVGDNITDG
jgi:hypothetical protein